MLSFNFVNNNIITLPTNQVTIRCNNSPSDNTFEFDLFYNIKIVEYCQETHTKIHVVTQFDEVQPKRIITSYKWCDDDNINTCIEYTKKAIERDYGKVTDFKVIKCYKQEWKLVIEVSFIDIPDIIKKS